MVLALRVNSLNCVGFCYDSSGAAVSGAAAVRLRPLCSPLLLCEPLATRSQPAPAQRDLPPGACVVNGGRAARALVTALTHERSWAVLARLLTALPPLLGARGLATGRRPHDLDLLAATLATMVRTAHERSWAVLARLLTALPPLLGARGLATGRRPHDLDLLAATLATMVRTAHERSWAVLARLLTALPPLLGARGLATGRRPHDLDLLAATLATMVRTAHERSWAVLARLLTALPPLLGARGLATGRRPHDLDLLAATLATMVRTAHERSWAVLARLLTALPPLLGARGLATGRRPHDLDLLAATLATMVTDRTLYYTEARGSSLGGAGGAGGAGNTRPPLSEFHGHVLPALCALAPYHPSLEPATQQRIVRCLLRHGMVLRTPQPYINALTIFTLEMRETMVRMLPEVLLDLSKISDTQAIASPMLEFLSTLTRLPMVFASFVEDQYMSVFAILLPYTNPSRYNHYVVSLAHHVIAAWFLKCRLSYRRNFVRFIIHVSIDHHHHQYMSVFAILLPYTNPSRYNHYVVSLAHHVIAAWFLKCRLSYRRNFVRFIIHVSIDHHHHQYMSVFAILLPYTNPSRYNHYVVSLAHHVIAAWFLKCRLSYRRNFVRFIIHVSIDHHHHQYMSVFAILLPYTNPSRYNHYVVSLAHHVIAAWFLKCRLSYRRNFVRFIIHGLHNYIILPFEEQLQYKSNYFHAASSSTAANEDSSNRQRSSSLGSKAVSRVPMGRQSAGSSSASASAAFHVELTETCVDLLARYSTTPASVKPQRTDLAEFLFTGGQSMTWLVGHKLITITTSGCLQNSIKQGLCDRCAVLCRQHADSVAAAYHDSEASTSGVQVSVSEDSVADSSQASSATPEVRRQNSSENSKASDPLTDAINQFTQRFDRISKEVDGEEAGWSRVGALSAAGQCPCWCGRWAEVLVRAPTGDAAFTLRAQHRPALDHDLALADLAALLAPDRAPRGPGPEEEVRSRSGSASSAPPAPPDLHKSSSDTVVASEKKPPHAATHCIVPPQPHRSSTQPINIPASPQRHAASAALEDDMLLIVPEGKSRHPVRRSNSSPEMSSSWKTEPPPLPNPHPHPHPHPQPLPLPAGAGNAAPATNVAAPPRDMIHLPGTEPASASACMHATKKAAKKSDMRVSCEAIPEEMCGTSPLSHPHLVTYNSDPGTVDAEDAAADQAAVHHQLQKTASDSTVTSGAHRPPLPRSPAVLQGPGLAAGPAWPAWPPGPRVGAGPAGERDDLPPLSRSKRSHTISVMSPTRRHRENLGPRSAASSNVSGTAGSSTSSSGGGGGASNPLGGGASGGGGGGGLTPAFIFLQLYHNMSTHPVSPPVPGEAPTALNPLAERPLRVTGVQHERTIKNLDLVPPLETYKVGVLYVGPGQQDNEVLILKNEYGSVRYSEFLSALGSLVPLDGEEHPHLFLNLEKGGKDGAYTYVWHDDVMQVLFHVATAMPSSAKDPTCNEKRKYIGNDYVSIVYNDSGADFNIHTIKGQFNFCIVVVEPYEHGLNRVFIKSKDERLRGKFLAHLDTQVVGDGVVALLARQLALHAALASQISQSLRVGGAPYASNSLERLRIIKRLRRRLQDERLSTAAVAPPYHPAATDLALRVAQDDFNAYTF
ncbi:unnamed protein product [Chilo suppressalis]|uniref:Rap-GAP domain-containing protein n=1 Tax=Chilo suppressalis TaxID=168631 RepID=A0ABN8AY04_CHISP|nr:unnamed protein product [Chilo suppressalis]